MTAPRLTMLDERTIPQLGVGTRTMDPGDVQRAVEAALETGYRHIDAAALHGGEQAVARAVAASGLPREDLFLAAELPEGARGRDDVMAACDAALERLGTDHVDLCLLRRPGPQADDRPAAWRAMGEIRDSGLARSVGVADVPAGMLQEAVDTGVMPMVHQIELHPWFPQIEMWAAAAAHGILTEARSPLSRGEQLLEDPVIVGIAEEIGATPAQTVLAWHLAIGDVVVPTSVTPEHIRENWGALDIVLGEEELEQITALGREDGRVGRTAAQLG